MNLTVDCVLTNQLSVLPSDSGLAYLLGKANVTWLNTPLEALVCDQHGLNIAPDYPIAAIAANADGLDVGNDYWLRADPVHLTMQRDSFSLSEPAPMPIARAHAESIVESLNQHFNQTGLTFLIGNSGAWYLCLKHTPEIKTSLPSESVGKNVFQLMPQGEASAKWRAYLNEVQMLLFSHPVNTAREASGMPIVNSIWLSGGGVMPLCAVPKKRFDLIVANSALYRGLAEWAGLPSHPLSMHLNDDFKHMAAHQHVRLQLQGEYLSGGAAFKVLLNALKAKKIKELTLHLGCYEKTLIATITYWDTLKFWRKSKPVMQFLV